MTKKILDIENEKLFRELAIEILTNHSNATSNIRWRLRRLMGEYGYEIDWETRTLKEKAVSESLKVSRIVSKGRKTISEEKIAEIKKMRSEGHSVRSIAKLVRVGEGTVKKYIKN